MFEAGRERDAIITQRRGVGTLRVVATGVAAHSGNEHHKGRNAITSLARFVDCAQSLTDYDRGTTVNTGLIQGGTSANTVPAHAEATLVVEADRAREFLPVKNHDGADSPATVQAGLLKLYRQWLTEAGAVVAPQARIEISPLFATDAADVKKKIKPGQRFDSDRCIE